MWLHLLEQRAVKILLGAQLTFRPGDPLGTPIVHRVIESHTS